MVMKNKDRDVVRVPLRRLIVPDASALAAHFPTNLNLVSRIKSQISAKAASTKLMSLRSTDRRSRLLVDK